MGFWAGIKHALNSTLGTDDFKPLNQMIQDVNNNVISQKRLAPSDNIIAVLANNRDDYTSLTGIIGTRYDYPVTKKTFIATSDGAIRLFVDNQGSESNSYVGYVYEGDTTADSIYDYVQKTSFNIAEHTTSTVDIDVFKNKKYKIVIYSSASYGQSIGRPIKIGAHIVDGLTFDIQRDMA